MPSIFDWEALNRVSMTFSAVAIPLVCFILALSTVTTSTKASLGTKIFVVNLMVLDLMNAVLTFYTSLQNAFPLTVLEWWTGVLGEKLHSELNGGAYFIIYLTITIFGCTMIPMTSMSILACYRPKACTGKMAAKYFFVLVLLADMIPVLFVAACVPLVNFSSAAPRTVLLYGVIFKSQYTALFFLLYLTDMALAVAAVCILHAKTVALNSAGPSSTARRNLRHLILFAIPPYIVQIPYILRQISFFILDNFVTDGESFWNIAYLTTFDVARAFFALKPAVDALSTVLFLGEYRKNCDTLLSCIKWCFVLLPQPPTVTQAAHVGANGNAQNTVSPVPNSFSSVNHT